MLQRVAFTRTRALFIRRLAPMQVVQQPQQWQAARRCLSSKVDLDKEIETITDLATTAKDEMDFAEESRNSVYYNSDKVTAHDAVEELKTAYNGLLARLSDADKEAIRTRIGMKVKEIQSAYEIMTQNDLEE
ncbi:hypothetical protein H4R20_000414 [Coemansia guatemalensis]|uniref:Uncharacterized protein n=1 Tax=Coemansia guatemalensis TaxID=2761395 RepID=A0A9W8I133_9FUNG|nr:hypothetical protein H4R20_000414 [Coemansia guatemalensis]